MKPVTFIAIISLNRDLAKYYISKTKAPILSSTGAKSLFWLNLGCLTDIRNHIMSMLQDYLFVRSWFC